MLQRAVELGTAIRGELLGGAYADAVPFSRGLRGACAIAAILLAIRLDDPATFRMGFFLKRERSWDYRCMPNDHAWSVVDDHVVDVTATQFGRYRAVHVADHATAALRYVELAAGPRAVREIRSWGYAHWPRLERQFRQLL